MADVRFSDLSLADAEDAVKGWILDVLCRMEERERQTFSLRAGARFVHRREGDLRDAVKSGQVPAERRGKNWIIKRSDLERWVAAGCPV